MTTTRTQVPLIGSGVSTHPDGRVAIEEALERALPALGGEQADLAIVFASPHHAQWYAEIVQRLARHAPTAVQLGCTGEGVIATKVEVEDAPGLAVWLARLPGVRIEPVQLRYRVVGHEGRIDGFRAPRGERAVLILLADPFTFPADLFLQQVNAAIPRLPILGGMASGGHQRGTIRLFFQGSVLDEGAVGVLLTGNVAVATVVSQGCRPLGAVHVVTKAEQNVIHELDGAPTVRKLEELYRAASERDQLLMRRGLHVGVAVGAREGELGRGDFVIRNVVGMDPESGALAITDVVEEGRLVQFHVRDADSARQDLRMLLDAERLLEERRPVGALLFSCNGRGQRLFGQPHHDASALGRVFGALPVAGFFCAGELGPVAGRNFLHGFTASIALFLPWAGT